jgi:hypothetical protein
MNHLSIQTGNRFSEDMIFVNLLPMVTVSVGEPQKKGKTNSVSAGCLNLEEQVLVLRAG